MEGETNPRNLHLIFGIWPLVMAHFELAEYTEDVFELFSCYFPIDFNPSKVGQLCLATYDLIYFLLLFCICKSKFVPKGLHETLIGGQREPECWNYAAFYKEIASVLSI